MLDCKGCRRKVKYTNSLVNADSFYGNFTNTTFQKNPIPHLTRIMKQKFLHLRGFYWILYEVTYLRQNLGNRKKGLGVVKRSNDLKMNSQQDFKVLTQLQ